MKAALIMLMLGGAAQPALAQSRTEVDTGSRIGVPERARIPTSPKLTDEQAAQVTMNRYMGCVVQRSRAQAERYVALPVGSPEARKLVPSLASAECLSAGELRFKPSLMRGGIYEALYRLDHGRTAPSDLAGRAPVDYQAGMAAGSSPQLALLAFGDCVTRADPKGVHALLLSAPATKAEGRAVSDLLPSLNACVSRGLAVRFSRPVLRGVVAETTYRVAKAPVLTDAVAGSGTR